MGIKGSKYFLIDGTQHISVPDAGAQFGFAPDYVAALCRDGKIRAVKRGRQWFVNRNSLGEYVAGAAGFNWGCLYYNNSALGTCASDESIKKDITSYSGGLNEVAGLNPVFFRYDTQDDSASLNIGLIAQQVQTVAPELVGTTTYDGRTILDVNYSMLTYMAINAIKNINSVFNATDASTSAPSLISYFQGTTTPAIVIDGSGDLSIGTTTATSTTDQQLCLNGDCTTNLPFAVSNGTTTASFDASFLSALEQVLVSWLGTANNGIQDLFTKNLYATNITTQTLTAQEVCMVDGSGTDIPLCMNKSEFGTLLSIASSTLSTGSGQANATSSAPLSPNFINEVASAVERAIGSSTASDAANLQDLPQTATVESGVPELMDDVLAEFNTMGVTVSQDLLHAVKIVADNLQVGSAAHPTGITMYDTVTDQPYCFEMTNGQATTTQGACVDILPDATSTADASSTTSTDTDTATSTDDTQTSPVIAINGANPATINVGDTYADLGATITGPEQDLNLGIHLFLNGAPIDQVQIDTSAVATDTIDYVVTDQSGLTATSTRTVFVVLPAQAGAPQSSDSSATSTDSTSSDSSATSTDATSTQQ